MRLICMFDLPIETPSEKKNYRRFRKNLIREGFVMVQYSVYIRTCPNRDYVRRLTKRIESFSPENGHIRLISVTEKQYENMKIIIGSKRNSEIVSGSKRLIIL